MVCGYSAATAQAVTSTGETQEELDNQRAKWLENRKTKSELDLNATEIRVETTDDRNKSKTSSNGSSAEDKIIRRTTTTADQVEEATP